MGAEPADRKPQPTVSSLVRRSDCDLVVTRIVNAPPRLVFEAWTKADLFKRWWVPKSLGMVLLSCEMDVRVGGGYRLVFQHPAFPEGMAFHGRYLEVEPAARLVWTNEEEGGAGQITTVTFEDLGATTKVVLVDRYPSKAVLDEALASGSTAGDMAESFAQLEELLGVGAPGK